MNQSSPIFILCLALFCVLDQHDRNVRVSIKACTHLFTLTVALSNKVTVFSCLLKLKEVSCINILRMDIIKLTNKASLLTTCNTDPLHIHKKTEDEQRSQCYRHKQKNKRWRNSLTHIQHLSKIKIINIDLKKYPKRIFLMHPNFYFWLLCFLAEACQKEGRGGIRCTR